MSEDVILPRIEAYHSNRIIKCPHCRGVYEIPPRCCKDALVDWIRERAAWITIQKTPEGFMVLVKMNE